MNRDSRYIITGFSALIIAGLLLIFVLLPPEDEPTIPIQPVGEQIIDTGNGEGNTERLEVLDNVTIAKINGTSGTGQAHAGRQGSGGGGGGGGTARDATPPTVTGIFSRPPDIDGVYTHPLTVTWVGEDDRSGIDFCDAPTNYSGPDGRGIVLVGHCTDKAGNEGAGNVNFNYNSTRFVPLLSYGLALSSDVVNVGSNISATATTNDTSITNVVFVWKDPSNNTETSSIKTVTTGSATDIFTAPNKTGTWTVDAQFKNGTQTDIAIISRSFNVTTTTDGGNGDGNGGGGGNGGGEQNHAPVAANDSVTTLQNVPTIINVLDNDSDPDGDSISISGFTQPGNGNIADNKNGTLTYIPKENFAGHDNFTYKITDGALESSFANVTIFVTPSGEDQHLTANAGPDQSVDEETLVSLAGSTSEDVATIVWSQLAGELVTLIGPDTLTPTFLTPSISHSGPTITSMQLTFELVVTNDQGTSASDTVVITVNDVNKSPVANAGPDQTVNENDLAELAGSGSDPDGDAITFSWLQTGGPSVELSDATSPTPSFRAPHVTEDTELTFELKVSDGLGGVSTDSVKITVLNRGDGDNGGGEDGASLRSTGGSGKLAEGINFGFTVQLNEHTEKVMGNLEYQDKSKDINLHSISITSLTIDGNTARFEGTATINGEGEYSFAVTVEDNGEPGNEDRFNINIPELDYNVGGAINNGNLQVH